MRAYPGSLRRAAKGRRGYGLIEVAIAIFLLTVVLGVMVKVIGWVGIERRAADRRIRATQDVSNLLEHLSAEPYEAISTERANAILKQMAPAKELPDAKWEFEISEPKDSPLPCKRLSIRLRWNDRSGGWDGPVSLTSWVYRGSKS